MREIGIFANAHVAIYDSLDVRRNSFYYGRIENLRDNIAEKIKKLYYCTLKYTYEIIG